MTKPNFGYAGFLKRHTLSNEYEKTKFPIEKLLREANGAMPVEVIASYKKDDRLVVDIKIAIKQTDADGHGHSHNTIFEVPYLPLSGGGFTIEIEPQVGDTGLAIFCDRDISAFKESFQESLPASRRYHHIADAIYLGAFPSQSPNFSIKANFSEKRWDIVGDINHTGNFKSSGNTDIGGTLDAQGNIKSGGSVTDGGGIVLGTHTHTSGEPGSPTSPPE